MAGKVKLTGSQFRLWFFRDLSSAQRLKLFALAGMPVTEIGATHSYQEVALKHVMAALSQQTGSGETGNE